MRRVLYRGHGLAHEANAELRRVGDQRARSVSAHASRYFKRLWPEARGDHLERWGTCEYLFEVDEEAYPLRQIERYTNGPTLTYDRHELTGPHGGLGDQALDLDDFADFEIHMEEFERAWREARHSR